MGKESYKLEKDDFEGEDVCKDCPKKDGSLLCAVYSFEGAGFRSKNGYCPVVNRWASWREDKPVVMRGKKRIGQGKTRQGGN